ncbi:serine/threonine-protein kinase [Prauserella alba]|uniref:non-specific serine/threonine protein kinase n=1 Tax=Prauserella alba TaxID=176898 RepID=A0ABN1V9L2_9PSEU|nr:serine/threonine-protein kinase [Prauserella alba]MCP2181799.1 serine/threonine-protein kinase PknG [Prauserella alba]
MTDEPRRPRHAAPDGDEEQHTQYVTPAAPNGGPPRHAAQPPQQSQPPHPQPQQAPPTAHQPPHAAQAQGANEPMPTSVLDHAPGTELVMPPTPPSESADPSEGMGPPSGYTSGPGSGPASGPGSGPASGPGSGTGSGPGSHGSGTGSGSGPWTGSGAGTGGGAFPRTSRRSSSRTSTRGRLGAGMVEVPPVPYRDPAEAVLSDPVVSESKRFCSSCNAKVGRGSGDEAGSPQGTCDKCGTPFSFVPKLHPADLVGGQYEVLGALAYGGLGWIYLARDLNVDGRWVVLKGLINTGDATAMAAAVNEKRFLAEVEHPHIVKIYNFVQHPDPATGGAVDYIVMEYVGGQSLRQLALDHHRKSGRAEPLPIGQVIAYGLEILPALGYLHNQGLLYCDLKPDNVIQTGDQLKLIDLGAVRRMDDYSSPLFFTSGYSAPELASDGASVASDLFTVGRTLAVLSFEFTGYTTKFKTTLPSQDDVPLFQLFGSYYRFLRRATHADPARRFVSAEEMADQLTGVLREIMALGTGKQRPGQSTVFGPETNTFGVDMVVPDSGRNVPLPDPVEVVSGLPVPQVDTDDVGAGVLAATLGADPRAAIEALAGAPRESIEVRLRVVRARIELGELAEANRQLQAAQYLAIKAGFPHDWRIDWYRGLIELAGGRARVAHVAFDTVYDELPGETAPKLAMAFSAEATGEYFTASRLYELVWRTDRSYVSAAFGLARVYLAQGARASAIEVLESVPATSTHHVPAQLAAIKVKITPVAGQQVTEADLVDASARLERLNLDAERRTRLAIEVLSAALDWVGANERSAGTRVLGCGLDDRDVRLGLESHHRSLARLVSTAAERIELVDKANALRPRTLT